MGEIKINDMNLLKYCNAKTAGLAVEEIETEGEFPKEKCVCFGEYREDGEPLWVAVLYHFKKYHECMLDMTLNTKGLFSRKLFERMARVVFDYIFNQAGLLKCCTKVRISNTRSLRITKAYGLEPEGYIKKGFGPPLVEDMVLFGMLKENCRWI